MIKTYSSAGKDRAKFLFVAGSGSEPVKVSGYASVFNVDDRNGTHILTGAFDEWIASLGGRPVPLRSEHMLPNIGRATVSVDDYGLRFEGELTPGHSRAQDVAAELAHGTVDGVSIGYYWPSSRDREEREDRFVMLKRVEVFEISLTSTPANTEARLDVYNAINDANSLSEIEAALRDACGLSRREACALVSRVRNLTRGDRADSESDTTTAAIVAAIRGFKL